MSNGLSEKLPCRLPSPRNTWPKNIHRYSIMPLLLSDLSNGTSFDHADSVNYFQIICRGKYRREISSVNISRFGVWWVNLSAEMVICYADLKDYSKSFFYPSPQCRQRQKSIWEYLYWNRRRCDEPNPFSEYNTRKVAFIIWSVAR